MGEQAKHGDETDWALPVHASDRIKWS